MPNYKNCRNAKTAEEYLLKCLFQVEDERDKQSLIAMVFAKLKKHVSRQQKKLRESLKRKPRTLLSLR